MKDDREREAHCFSSGVLPDRHRHQAEMAQNETEAEEMSAEQELALFGAAQRAFSDGLWMRGHAPCWRVNRRVARLVAENTFANYQ